jgi:aryl-phospho-beta-D-glucosidase BglC (GH1 family)
MSNRYKNDDTIIGFDLENEPHGALGSPDGYAKWDNSNDENNWKKSSTGDSLTNTCD